MGQILSDTVLIDFISKCLSTLVGAAIAFYFGFRLYKRQKREEHKAYLQYAVSVLGQLSSQLYVFKVMVQKRYTESVEQTNKLESAKKNPQDVHIEMRETGNYIFGADFDAAFTIERLDFLVKREPNLIILLGTLISSVKSLNHLVVSINQEMEKYAWQDGALNPSRMMLTFQKNKLLYEQLDSTLYLTEKAMGLLIKFGTLEYKKDMKIKSSEITDEKYKLLKPKSIPSWEDDYKWFSKNPSYFRRKLCCLCSDK